jgi:hypothetical protein
MPKKFSLTDKKGWLDDYEAGKPEASIARDYRCDLRTVTRGIEEARRQRDAEVARIDLLKQAVLKHQERLLKKLGEILSALTIPTHDWAVLAWGGDGQSVPRERNLHIVDLVEDEKADDLETSDVQADMVEDMLKQHLSGDKLWKALSRREKAYSVHRQARISFQYKVVDLLEGETGYKLEAQGGVPPPFLYSYTAGDLLYRMTLQGAFGDRTDDAWQDEIIADTKAGCVRYRNMILAEVPGKAEECRKNLLEAFRKMESVPEVTRILITCRELQESTFKARQAAEEIRILDLVPGRCKICRRLGM